MSSESEAEATSTSQSTLATRQSLIESVAKSDGGGRWEEFDRTYRGIVLGMARKAGLNHHDAEDVAQEVFSSLVKSLVGFELQRRKGAFRKYLFQLVRWRVASKFDQLKKTGDEKLARLQDRSLPAPGLLAHILVGKYCDHLPLYRQERIYATLHGVNLPRQTLARWVELAADWLRPVYQQIRTGVLAGGYVQVDETPIGYLDPGRGRTGPGYLWTCAVPHGDVVFHWETSRATECLGNVLPADFTGTVQCDGYAAYPAFARQHPKPLTLAGCWAHVRRKFH